MFNLLTLAISLFFFYLRHSLSSCSAFSLFFALPYDILSPHLRFPFFPTSSSLFFPSACFISSFCLSPPILFSAPLSFCPPSSLPSLLFPPPLLQFSFLFTPLASPLVPSSLLLPYIFFPLPYSLVRILPPSPHSFCRSIHLSFLLYLLFHPSLLLSPRLLRLLLSSLFFLPTRLSSYPTSIFLPVLNLFLGCCSVSPSTFLPFCDISSPSSSSFPLPYNIYWSIPFSLALPPLSSPFHSLLPHLFPSSLPFSFSSFFSHLPLSSLSLTLLVPCSPSLVPLPSISSLQSIFLNHD